ncbi:3-deoxy-7-phosphoheptulonate synthase [Trichosporon asahii var. asahii CBS 8904]|uniref:Phospho-2-dehydro-3-deoxyheptonate aldolase n=2 Tax=Trichosporon asahii var. asahii TaxID=189963 RepID=K1VZB0_TRIAC|nr:3-deoxy-7-phosphoheptulonate synthase [Trichosporon asahii var. asahii CBS 2479]EJT53289.1 3-deoxy-7-phosphoheptulonate synthase [Trichosporon asahii var. asahii CBS 2479]EKD02103.1 3-deoxy-7-phosphoheptulonate synthase [Trichosporon asahii var. asahii CBS 8904]
MPVSTQSPDRQRPLDDDKVTGYDPLIPPALLRHDLPVPATAAKTISAARRTVRSIVRGTDPLDRLLVVVGPCSIHDVDQAKEYATKLRQCVQEGRWGGLEVVMRVYFEKPRTTVGWKGLINDPDIDNSFQINKGLRIARELLCDINAMGMPVGCELLDTISPQFIADLITWGAIGARTTESQLHRELASGASFPIGFKNGTDGSVGVAIDAMQSAAHPHNFMGINSQGMASIVKTSGNRDCHVILRGGSKGPNFKKEDVQAALGVMKKKNPEDFASIMVDCSHGNSNKNHRNQPLVAEDVAKQIAEGELSITGIMIESNLREGNQKSDKGRDALEYGVSITDACIDWETTVQTLDVLNKASLTRRELLAAQHAASDANPAVQRVKDQQ